MKKQTETKPVKKAKPVKKTKPVKETKPVKKQITKKAKPEKKFDLNKFLKSVKVEYFNDRFYKLILPLITPAELIIDIPENFIFRNNNNIELFLPSSTTIIEQGQPRPYLEIWRGNLGNFTAEQILKDSQIKGKNIHHHCEAYAKGSIIVYQNKDINNIHKKDISYLKRKYKSVSVVNEQSEMIQIARFSRLFELLKPEIKEIETEVYNLEIGYAGTLDFLFYFPEDKVIKISRNQTLNIKSGYYVADIKSGNYLNENNAKCQLASYMKAHKLKDIINGIMVIHLNADVRTGIQGVKILMETENINYYYNQFLNLHQTFIFNKPESPKLFDIPAVLIPQSVLNKKLKRKAGLNPEQKKGAIKK